MSQIRDPCQHTVMVHAHTHIVLYRQNCKNKKQRGDGQQAVPIREHHILYNIRRIRPFLTTYWTQLLVQAMVLSCLDYCNSLLAGLPASAIRPLQLIQNAAARLIFNVPRYMHATPPVHWPPLAACHSSNQIQDIGACIPGSQGISPSLHPTAHQTLHTCQTSPLCYLRAS